MIVSISAVILVSNKKILLGKRPVGSKYAGLWEIPGGKQEPGETVAAAALREIREELDIDVRNLQSFAVSGWDAGDDFYVLKVFTGTPSGEPKLSPAHEVLEWFSFETLAPRLLSTIPITKPDIPILESFYFRHCQKVNSF